MTATGFDDLRRDEYDHVHTGDRVYLDWAGSGLASRSQLRIRHDRISGSRPAGDTGADAVLGYLRADPTEYTVVPTPDATAALRRLAERYPFRRGGRLVLTADNHSATQALHRSASTARTRVTVVPPGDDLRVPDAAMVDAVTAPGAWRRRPRRNPRQRRHGLLVYPAQSNLTGVRHPLHWVDLGHEFGYDVLVDAAAYLPTAVLRLDRVRPDFVAVSWHKMFGQPGGCLVARHDALARLHRRPPRVAAPSVTTAPSEASGAPAENHHGEAWDGGDDVAVGLAWMRAIGVARIQAGTERLTGQLLADLTGLRHDDGRAMVRVHGPADGVA